jgi:hypothetical protein
VRNVNAGLISVLTKKNSDDDLRENLVKIVLGIRILRSVRYVFGPLGSLYNQAKMLRKTLIPTIFDFVMTFYLIKMI